VHAQAGQRPALQRQDKKPTCVHPTLSEPRAPVSKGYGLEELLRQCHPRRYQHHPSHCCREERKPTSLAGPANRRSLHRSGHAAPRLARSADVARQQHQCTQRACKNCSSSPVQVTTLRRVNRPGVLPDDTVHTRMSHSKGPRNLSSPSKLPWWPG
jgi:hypothetical protein